MFSCKFSAYFLNVFLWWRIWRAVSEFKDIWKVFYISLLNLATRNCNEIDLLKILIVKSFYYKDEKLYIFLRAKNNLHKELINELLIITSKLL